MALHIDEKSWPLTIVTVENVTYDETLQHLKRMEAWLSRKETFAVLFVARGNANVEQRVRQAYADFMKKNAEAMKEHMAGLAIVVENAFIRAIVTSILWLQPIPTAYKTINNDLEAGKHWAMEQLKARGVQGTR